MNTENTQNNAQSLEIENQTYRLEEMSDAMKASLTNAEEVMKQQNDLVEIVLSSDKANDFRDFIKDIESQIDHMKQQHATLHIRANLLDQVIDMCKTDENIAKAISIFCVATGMFQQN